jgi:hypothetical protein
MKKTVVVLAMIVAGSIVESAAFADDDRQVDINNALARLGRTIDNAFSQDSDTKAWIPAGSSIVDGKATCAEEIEKLAELGAPGSSKVKLSNDTAELTKGEHTLDDMLPICERIVAFGKTKAFQRQLMNAFLEYPKVNPKTPYNVKHFENCLTEYGKMMKAGVPPTYKIPDQMVADNDAKMVKLGGTVEELRKKWCDDGLKNARAERERRDAPYKKALKGDKLALALSWRALYLPGGKLTENPAEMAKSNVLFTDGYPGLVCLKKGVPEVHEITRYEFDASGKMTGNRSTKHCGFPGASGFK